MRLAPGTRLGPYEVLSPLGAGGMGEVYRARDVRLERIVALKVLQPDLAADDAYRQRFLREARAASALCHPNIAQVYDVGAEDGTHFIAMEYVEGQNLREALSAGPLSADRVIDAGIQMASALEEAHGKGVVHRDIKPANAVVSSKGVVKVLDFGLARLSGGASLDSQLVTEAKTQAGVVMGTVPYMSPEQALGRDMDGRTDIFSLGVVLYELAAGRLPFMGHTATEMIDRICHDTPEPLARTGSGIPPELERIVARCLEKDRELRYPSAGHLLADLHDLRSGREPRSRPSRLAGAGGAGGRSARGAPILTGRWSRARWAGVAAGVLTAVGVAAGLLAFLPRKAAAIDSIAVLPFRNESGNPDVDYLSDGITESLINALARAPALKIISRTSSFAFKTSKDDVREIGRKLRVRALLVGRMVQHGDRLAVSAELVDALDSRQLWGGRYERALSDVMALEREITETLTKTLHIDLVGGAARAGSSHGTDDPEAYRLYLRGRHFAVGTSQEMQKALEAFQQAVKRDPRFALAHAALAGTYLLRITHGEADPKEAVPAAREALGRALAIEPDLPEAQVIAGRLAMNIDWDWAAADAAFTRAMSGSSGGSDAYLFAADYYWAMGRFPESLAAARRALELDPLSRTALHHVAFAHLAAGDTASAIPAFMKALEIYPDWIWGYTKLSVSYALGGRRDEALAAAAKAEELALKGGETELLRSWLGATYAKVGEVEKARASLARLDELEKGRSPDRIAHATIHAMLGEKEKALDLIERGYEEHSTWMPFVPEYILFVSLRDEPRFKAIVARLGIPKPPA